MNDPAFIIPKRGRSADHHSPDGGTIKGRGKCEHRIVAATHIQAATAPGAVLGTTSNLWLQGWESGAE